VALSRHPGPWPLPRRVHDIGSGVRSRLRIQGMKTSLEARPPFTRAAFPFWGARVSLFEARCRLSTSATAGDERAISPSSPSSLGRGPQSASVFDPQRPAPEGGAIRAGEPRFRASHSRGTGHGFLPQVRACPGTTPRLCAPETEAEAPARRRAATRPRVRRTERRMRPPRCGLRPRWGCVRCAHADFIPILGDPSDIRCRQCNPARERRPTRGAGPA
jgi:hypothetical protein